MTDEIALDEEGWWPAARRSPSPNCDLRPPDMAVELVVVHAISLPPDCFGGGAIEALFLNRLDPAGHPYFESVCHLQVSAHFLIRRDGELVQFVPTTLRAWHAGQSCWQGRERCNDFSVGVELEGCDTCAFEPVQYVVLARLIEGLRRTHPIRAVLGHSEIAPGRKTDPGPCFDWSLLMASLDVPLARA